MILRTFVVSNDKTTFETEPAISLIDREGNGGRTRAYTLGSIPALSWKTWRNKKLAQETDFFSLLEINYRHSFLFQ